MLASFAAHAVAAVTASVVLPLALRGDAQEVEIEVDLAHTDLPAEVPPSSPQTPEASPQPSRPIRSPHHKRAVINNLPRRNDDRPSAAAPAQVASGSLDERAPPVRFALSAGTLATLAPSSRPDAAGAHAGTGSGSGTSIKEEILSEKDVNVPARLISSSPVPYPPEARQAEIEVDVPVQIVVDAGGHVVEARSLSHHGYGLDEAAVQAIRTWSFSPALRAGHPARVRMRWTVQFRLR